MYCKKGALRNIAKFTEYTCARVSFFNKVIKKEALAQVFSCKFCKISKNTFSYRTPPVAASDVSITKCFTKEATRKAFKTNSKKVVEKRIPFRKVSFILSF